MLQAYSLKKALEKENFDVYFIDYRIDHLSKRYSFFQLYKYKNDGFKRKMKQFISVLFHLKERYITINKFKSFEKKYFPLLDLDHTNELDFVVVGSDQIWNPCITGGYNAIYWGELSKLGVLHISYAASCPSKYVTMDQLPLLKNFVSIGIREETTLVKIKSLDIQAYYTIDPSLLLSAYDYEPLLERSRIKKKFIFIYNLNGSSQLYIIANRIRNRKDFSILGNFYSKEHAVDIVYRDAGPKDFVTLIKNAEATVVSSFHGTAFSIIFHKPFVYYPFGNEKDERAFSIIKPLGLEACIYNDKFDYQSIYDINWEDVDRKLNVLRHSSLDYLKENLKEN